MSERKQFRTVLEFYDSIAPDYDSHMTESDKKARLSVRDLFRKYVTSGNILDFGGGTGLDLPWMVESGYNVLFMEPSEKMRAIAHQRIQSNNVTFINDWGDTRLFQQKVNGIFANFAVFNCIENDFDVLFQTFARISSDNCYVVVTVIDPRFGNMIKHYSIVAATKMLLRSRLTIQSDRLPTYIHSISSLRKTSCEYFTLQSIVALDVSSFAVLIFKKK